MLTRPLLKAFILAAGKGTRLRPYTDKMPKPMVEIAGRSIIQRSLDALEKEGVKDVVINLHYLAPILEEHLRLRSPPRLTFSHEDTLLETGGGIKKMLPFFEGNPFYILNGDALWSEGEQGTALARLASAWNDKKMDILLLLQPIPSMVLTKPVGDYHINSKGELKRSKTLDGTHMFTGIRIAHPRIFEGSPDHSFSFLSLMDKAEEKGRLFGIVHSGAWHHISTPEDLMAVRQSFSEEG